MNEQIDNLLTPRVMVTNPWPGGCHKAGDILIGKESCVVPIRNKGCEVEWESIGRLIKDYPSNIRLLEWWHRPASEMPAYLKTIYGPPQVFKAIGWRYDSERMVMWCKTEGAFDWAEMRHPENNCLIPATSAQYLEYLTQQSKP